MNHDDYLKYIPEAVRKDLEAKHRTSYDSVDWALVTKACDPYLIGKSMKLSGLSIGSVGKFPDSDEKFIVHDRYPEDRCSGGTTIMYESGTIGEFVWDYGNPQVIYLGRGKLKTSIEMDNSQ